MDNHMDNNPNGNRPDNNKGPGRQDPNKNHQSILAFLVCLLVTLVCFAMFTNMLKDNSSEITYDKFIEMVDDGDVKEVTLQSNTLTITPKHQSSGFSEEVYYANQMESVDKLTERLEGTGIKFEYKKPDAAGEIISMLVSVLLPTIQHCSACDHDRSGCDADAPYDKGWRHDGRWKEPRQSLHSERYRNYFQGCGRAG